MRPKSRFCAAAPYLTRLKLTQFSGSFCNLSGGPQLHLVQFYIVLKSYERFDLKSFFCVLENQHLKQIFFSFSNFALICERFELECPIKQHSNRLANAVRMHVWDSSFNRLEMRAFSKKKTLHERKISHKNVGAQYFCSHLRKVEARVPYKVAFEPAYKCGSNACLLEILAPSV